MQASTSSISRGQGTIEEETKILLSPERSCKQCGQADDGKGRRVTVKGKKGGQRKAWTTAAEKGRGLHEGQALEDFRVWNGRRPQARCQGGEEEKGRVRRLFRGPGPDLAGEMTSSKVG